MTDPILFYSPHSPYGCFSNFSRHSVKLDGHTWKTSEHYFQAQKFLGTDPKQFKAIQDATKPGEAASMGRDRSKKLRRDWESAKNDVMRKVIRAKFTQHEDCKAELLSTGDAKLVEHTEKDTYWADGGDGSGKNWLGIILMEIREELKG